MPREKGRKGTNGGRNLETLVKLAAPAIGTAAGAFTVVGIIYLGMTLAGLLRGGGGEIRKSRCNHRRGTYLYRLCPSVRY